MTPDEIAQAILNIINAVAKQQGTQPIDSTAIANILQMVNTFLNAQQQGQQPAQIQAVLESVLAALARQQGAAGQIAALPQPAGQDLLHLVLGALLGKQLTLPQPAQGAQSTGTSMPALTSPPATSGTTATTSSTPDQLQQAIKALNVMLGQTPALGQVNGALGDTIGNLLNGKKSAIGIGGSLLTALLMNVPTDASAVAGGSALVKMLAPIVGAVPGLGQVALPIFLAISAWGVLGKLEKWAQGTAPPPKPQS